jgi:hypothetical protein
MRYKRDFYFVQYNGETKQECVYKLKSFYFLPFHGSANNKCMNQTGTGIIL